MLYTNKELKSVDFDHQAAFSRYFNKFQNQKKEFSHLKFHEKDYFFSWMHLRYAKENKKNI